MNTDGEGRRVSLHGRLMRDDLNSTLWGNFAQLNLKWNNETWGESCELIIVAEVRSEGTDVGRREKICAAWFVWMCRTQMCHKIYVQVTQKSVRYFKSSILQLNNWIWWTEARWRGQGHTGTTLLHWASTGVSWTFFRNTLTSSSEPVRKWHQPLCHPPAGPLKARLSI